MNLKMVLLIVTLNVNIQRNKSKEWLNWGFLGMTVSTKYGGGGMDTISYALAVEEISKIDNSCSVILSAHNSLACWGIEEYGTEEQKEKFLKTLATGKKIGGFCLVRTRIWI